MDARPSLPFKEEKNAVGSGQVEVRLLVAKGADNDASKGNTPKDMAVTLEAEVLESKENTVIEIPEEDIIETILQPQNMVLCLGKKVAANTKLVKVFVETAVRIGSRKFSTQLSDEMIHLLVEEEEEDSLHSLTALVVGAEIVTTSWLLESENCLQFRCKYGANSNLHDSKSLQACGDIELNPGPRR